MRADRGSPEDRPDRSAHIVRNAGAPTDDRRGARSLSHHQDAPSNPRAHPPAPRHSCRGTPGRQGGGGRMQEPRIIVPTVPPRNVAGAPRAYSSPSPASC